MFSASTYTRRRQVLKKNMGTGIMLFLGNEESAMNYAANDYRFRQDSTFLYYFGLSEPGLAAVIDFDADEEILFGNDPELDDIIWMGNLPSLSEKAKIIGVKRYKPFNQLQPLLTAAIKQGRPVHYLPPYRSEHYLKINDLLGIKTQAVNNYISLELVKAVIAQRSIKSKEEIAQIEQAHAVTRQMHVTAMRKTRPGIYERDLAGEIEGQALAAGGTVSFPVILSVKGEILHNHYHGNRLKAGQLLVNDSGAETALGYAADITRTFPVSGRFTTRQADIYNLVLKAQLDTMRAIRPGKKYLDLHRLCSRIIAAGLKDLHLMRGNCDEAVQCGAHALFFPHGLGHMLGLDVHDMENLGENHVGYDARTKRSEQFGLAYLRLARKLEPGFVLTVEPGIYFIPVLIKKWQAEKKYTNFINYQQVEKFLDFGGIRIEDNVVITDNGCRVLGKPIPKTVAELENVVGTA
jgi:Xaa-Pro aminopeptidase